MDTQLDLIPPIAPKPFQIGDARFAFLTRKRPSEDMEAYIARDWAYRVKQERGPVKCVIRDNTAQNEAKRRISEGNWARHWQEIKTVLANGRELSAREIVNETGTDTIKSQLDYIAKSAKEGRLVRRTVCQGGVRFFAYRLPEDKANG